MSRVIATSALRRRALIEPAAARAELERLAGERARGETLAIHGDLWGGGDVVVIHPHHGAEHLELVDVDAERYPALARECQVRTPHVDEDGFGPPAYTYTIYDVRESSLSSWQEFEDVELDVETLEEAIEEVVLVMRTDACDRPGDRLCAEIRDAAGGVVEAVSIVIEDEEPTS